MRNKKQQGFTLIELMIVVAIIGILAAVAIPAFLEYMNSGKGSEGDIAINHLEKNAKAYYVKHSEYPDGSEAATPATDCCTQNKTTKNNCKAVATDWHNDDLTKPWGMLKFNMSDDGFRFQYKYDVTGSGTGYTAVAEADLDCDSNGKTTITSTGSNTNGNPSATHITTGDD